MESISDDEDMNISKNKKSSTPSTEAAILQKKVGTQVAEYVAECASGRCSYFGEFSVIFQERRVINENKAQFL